VDHLTVAELKKIWEPEAQGRITRWSQIRPEWPDKEIHLYGAGVASGTYDYFTEAIVGKSHSSRGDYTSSEDDNVLLTGVAGDPLSLGFFGIAYYEENKQNLKLVPVDDEKPENGAGPIIPTRANIMSNRYAPLSRPLFVYVNSAATQRPEVQRFVRFYLDRVSGLVDEVGYVPLPDSLYARERRNFEAFLQANVASTPVRSPQP
jgi:phosphate transport system substrate-binding protein